MEMILYKTADSENVINKTKVEIHRTNIELKKTISVVTPTIVLNNLSTIHLLKSNYCYLEKFDRFYFIRDITVDRTVIHLDLECDVLESFKTEILNSEAEINRKLGVGEYYANNVKTEIVRDIDIFKSDVILENQKNIILSAIGG